MSATEAEAESLVGAGELLAALERTLADLAEFTAQLREEIAEETPDA